MSSAAALRTQPDLADLFKRAESRHLTDDELDAYLALVPEHSARAAAAKSLRETDAAAVRKTITELYQIYPYEQHHQLAMPKCIRDVRYVSAYASHAMLLGDADWFRDKLLLWMKTILQSFEYPDIPAGSTRRLNPEPEARAALEKLKPHQRSIYECYYRLKTELRRALPPAAYTELEPYLQLPVDVLSQD
jgi:Phycobilisome protein